MTHHRYPATQAVGQEDIAAVGWRDLLAGLESVDWSALWHAFSNAARSAEQEGFLARARVLWLFADACSMRLVPSSSNAPYRPNFVMDGQRSAVPDDFNDDDLNVVEMAAADIDEPWLRSRLADLLWIARRPRRVPNALDAIDAYRQIPLEVDAMVAGGREGWARAIVLARMLRAAAGDRLAQLEHSIVERLQTAASDSRYMGLWLSDLLRENGLGESGREAIAQKLMELAIAFKEAGEIQVSRDYFAAASHWFDACQNYAQSMAALVEEAESWVHEAEARVSESTPSYLMASSNYESAIQTYRRVPREHRLAYKVDERLAELHALQAEAGARSVAEIRSISSPPVNITTLVDSAREAVRGKSLTEALLAFTSLYGGASWADARASAEEKIRRHPLSSMFSSVVMSRDGRVIARRPGVNLGGGSPEEEAEAIRAEAIRDFTLMIGLVIQGKVLPALETILVEGSVAEGDLVHLAHRSPIVPPGRERLIGKALFRGFEGDWASAVHLLTPQIENMIRFHLKQAGAKTTTLDPRGIETENSLSALTEMEAAKRVFGEDLVFEIQAVFCDPFGPNLRNEVAHGLLDDDQFASPYAVYAWWFALRLVFATWWNSTRRAASATPAEGSGIDDVGPAQ
ncbi:DUF4209 domain-containing protein [Luteimonas sp. MJ204]|uniref:DUF4209 domain-containing protein n=1 Tax=Luteimonas sp. MJ145 TaxID=3129234 RepID=UPI0031BA6261